MRYTLVPPSTMRAAVNRSWSTKPVDSIRVLLSRQHIQPCLTRHEVATAGSPYSCLVPSAAVARALAIASISHGATNGSCDMAS